MNRGLIIRIAVLVTLILALVITVGVTARLSWDRLTDLQHRHQEIQSGSLRAMAELKGRLFEAAEPLWRYDLTGRAADLEEFQARADALARWLEERSQDAPSKLAQLMLLEIQAGYDRYRRGIEQYLARRQADPAETASAGAARLENSGRFLLELDRGLAEAQQHLTERVFAQSQVELVGFRILAVASLLLNLVLGALVAVRVYREWIAPMRRQLIASRAMAERQEKLSSLGVLAAGIAHEIRNPLTSIKARLFAQHKLLPADSPAREDNAVIRDEIGRLEHIVMDFLAFARPTEPVLTELAASAPLEEIATLVRPELERSDIAVNVEVREDSRLRADPQQLKQILLNLVRNAAESIGRDGRITLRAGRRRLRQRGRWMPYAALEVSDTGKGIPPEIQKRLFDPFFTTKQNGTGLGLSITARLVAQQGGLLEYQTELNCGTTFCILLPCVTQGS